jgi:mono/diheme cytochrome c family protein
MSSRSLLLLLAPILAGCRQDMHDQPRYEPLQPSGFFRDERSARPIVEGTVARGQRRLTNPAFFTGYNGKELATQFPFQLIAGDLKRGQERFNIYCSPCHGRAGDGEGMIVQRGFSHPPTYHSDRLRNAPIGHFYDVITNGFGAMHSYASRVEPRDRWLIIAYIRALQLSQTATTADVPPDKIGELQ